MKKQILALSKVAGLITGVCFITITLSAPVLNLSASNISCYSGNGRWDWTIFTNVPEEVLENIKCVEYTLPPTFPNPVREVCDRGTGPHAFALSDTGWGVFEISIKVILKNGKVHLLKHMLAFEAPLVKELLPITADNVATPAGKGRWNWTVFIQAPEEVLNQIQLVKYILHHTFPNPEQEVLERGTGPHAFALSATGWGMFKIKIRVFLKNGQVQDLEHDLKF